MMTNQSFPSADDFAWAIIFAARDNNVDPVQVLTKGGNARYIALRLLMRAFPCASRRNIALLMGYSRPTSSTVIAPSAEVNYAFNKKVFEKLFKNYQDKLQKCAEAPTLIKETIINNAVIEDGEEKPYTIPKFDFVQVPAQGYNPRRKSLEDELRKAVLNTGGRVVK